MAWPKGVRRNPTAADRFIQALVKEFGVRGLAKLAQVSPRTVQRWASGEDWPSNEILLGMVDRIFPASRGALPLYSSEMAIDGNTRVGGVGQYTLEAAKGWPIYQEKQCSDLE